MDIKISGHEFYYDTTSMSMLFFPGEKVNYVKRSTKPVHIISVLHEKNDSLFSITKIKYNGKWYTAQRKAPINSDRKNLVKQTFFRACSKATGIIPPWGILTGIRPLSVYERHRKSGDNPRLVMKNEYFLSHGKINILNEISDYQNSVVCSKIKDASIYISIPFCPGKCSYCSFISVSAVNNGELLERYLEMLLNEIKEKADMVSRYKLNIKSLYIGGGTPGILSKEQIIKLFSVLSDCFNLNSIDEICFELGRPDTVTDEKLEILKRFGVDRICINTQTTNDCVLSAIGRNHTSSDYFSAVKKALKYNFKSINTDLIAGLPGESFDSFCSSVDNVINTGVDNITVHTLSIKRAAKLRDCGFGYDPVNFDVVKMLDFAYNRIRAAGLVPYYIYRQKNCISNGENIGFCKSETVCRYNIYMMEDVHTIIACGAGASSKIINKGKVDRIINVKYPMEYVKEYEKIIKNTKMIYELLKADFIYE